MKVHFEPLVNLLTKERDEAIQKECRCQDENSILSDSTLTEPTSDLIKGLINRVIKEGIQVLSLSEFLFLQNHPNQLTLRERSLIMDLDASDLASTCSSSQLTAASALIEDELRTCREQWAKQGKNRRCYLFFSDNLLIDQD